MVGSPRATSPFLPFHGPGAENADQTEMRPPRSTLRQAQENDAGSFRSYGLLDQRVLRVAQGSALLERYRAAATARPAWRPEKRQPPRKVPSNER